jgi:hypothetical protein
MAAKTPVYRRLIGGAGGALLILASCLPWAAAQSINRNGWELNATANVLFVAVGVVAIATAVTGGQFGFCRPDLSLIGATDLLGVTATLLLAWLLLFDFPEHATRQPGVFVALISAAAVAGAVGDYRPLRGAPMFPPVRTSEPRRANIAE